MEITYRLLAHQRIQFNQQDFEDIKASYIASRPRGIVICFHHNVNWTAPDGVNETQWPLGQFITSSKLSILSSPEASKGAMCAGGSSHTDCNGLNLRFISYHVGDSQCTANEFQSHFGYQCGFLIPASAPLLVCFSCLWLSGVISICLSASYCL